MNLSELINKRILIQKLSGYDKSAIEEIKIVEYSPSGNYVKILNSNGVKYWIELTKIRLVEILKEIINDIPKED